MLDLEEVLDVLEGAGVAFFEGDEQADTPVAYGSRGSSEWHISLSFQQIFRLGFMILQVLVETCLEVLDNTLGVCYQQFVTVHPRT